MKVIDNNISIIVQGSIQLLFTDQCLKSLRTCFPHAQIILSTWKGQKVDNLDYDKVVLLEDPGFCYINEIEKIPNNVNRQIFSTQAALSFVDRSYCLKIRSDILIENASFLSMIGNYDKRSPSNFFLNRLVICNYYTRNPRVYPMPFHPSDWIVFGRTEDVKELYNIALQSPEEMQWFKTHPKKSNFQRNCLSRFVPEQHIWLSFLRKHMEINCENYYDCSKENIVLTEELLAKCMVILDYQKQLGIKFLKYKPNRYGDKSTLLHHNDWKALYDHYCLHKNSMNWYFYLIKSKFYRCIVNFRACVIKILILLHLKSIIKNILNRF